MAYVIQTKRIPVQHYVGIRRRVKASEIGKACGEVLPRVGEYLRKKGARAASPPITLYHAHDERKTKFEVQPGIFLAAPIVAEVPWEAGTTPRARWPS